LVAIEQLLDAAPVPAPAHAPASSSRHPVAEASHSRSARLLKGLTDSSSRKAEPGHFSVPYQRERPVAFSSGRQRDAEYEVPVPSSPVIDAPLSKTGGCHRRVLVIPAWAQDVEVQSPKYIEKMRQVAEQMQKELMATHPYTIRAWSKAALLCMVS